MAIVPALIDIMMSGVAETSDFFLQQLFHSAGKEKNYIRIEPGSLESIKEGLDAASPSNIDKLVALGDRTVSENEQLLNQIARFLVEEQKHFHTKLSWNFLKPDR